MMRQCFSFQTHTFRDSTIKYRFKHDFEKGHYDFCNICITLLAFCLSCQSICQKQTVTTQNFGQSTLQSNASEYMFKMESGPQIFFGDTLGTCQAGKKIWGGAGTRKAHFRPQKILQYAVFGLKSPFFGLKPPFLGVSIHAPSARPHLQLHWDVFGTHLDNISCRRPYPATIGHSTSTKGKKGTHFQAKNTQNSHFWLVGAFFEGLDSRPQSPHTLASALGCLWHPFE